MTIRMGILGFGGMGNWHAQNAPKVEGVNIISAHDIEAFRLDDARAAGLQAYEDRAAFLADPEINFVLVATPNDSHKQFAIEAMRAGKHVMVEKPVAMNVAELDEIIAVSQQTGMLFTVHHNRRFDRDYCVMRKVVQEGLLGKVYAIESRVFGNNGQIYGWRQFPEHGGGMILDWGVHLLDHFTFMHPDTRITRVYAQAASMLNPQVDDYFRVELTFEDGLMAHVQVGTFGLRKLPRWVVIGDEGAMTIEDFSGKEGGIRRLKERLENMGKVIVNTEAGPTRTMAPQPEECFEDLPLPEITESWIDLYANLVGVLDGTAELIVTPATVRRTFCLIEAVFESVRTGQCVQTNL